MITSGQARGSIGLWRQYLDFIWLFDAVPPRADVVLRSAIARANRDRGLRFLPVYLRRYARMLLGFSTAGFTSEALAAPLVAGACFTLSTVAAVALMIAAIGFVAMRFGGFEYHR